MKPRKTATTSTKLVNDSNGKISKTSSKQIPSSFKRNSNNNNNNNNQTIIENIDCNKISKSSLPSSTSQIREKERDREKTSRLFSKGIEENEFFLTKQKQLTYTCFGCKKQINKDKYLLKACDEYWHENCLKCDHCHGRLGELGSTLYFKSNMKLCRHDYLILFGKTGICSVCEKLILATEMAMKAKQNVYHLECFACQLCNQRFCVGDRFYLCENKVVCQYDYEEHILPIQRSLFSNQQETFQNEVFFPQEQEQQQQQQQKQDNNKQQQRELINNIVANIDNHNNLNIISNIDASCSQNESQNISINQEEEQNNKNGNLNNLEIITNNDNDSNSSLLCNSNDIALAKRINPIESNMDNKTSREENTNNNNKESVIVSDVDNLHEDSKGISISKIRDEKVSDSSKDRKENYNEIWLNNEEKFNNTSTTI